MDQTEFFKVFTTDGVFKLPVCDCKLNFSLLKAVNRNALAVYNFVNNERIVYSPIENWISLPPDWKHSEFRTLEASSADEPKEPSPKKARLTEKEKKEKIVLENAALIETVCWQLKELLADAKTRQDLLAAYGEAAKKILQPLRSVFKTMKALKEGMPKLGDEEYHLLCLVIKLSDKGTKTGMWDEFD